jgi:UDP-N-acetylglucosamine acyltransferase
MIHPTAAIHPGAQIAEDVEIGPYVCIEGAAKIGAGCLIRAHAILIGEVELGERNSIGHGALIGGDPQDLSFKPETKSRVRIGSDNVIREYSTIHRGTGEGSETVIGDHNYLMGGVHLAHNTRIGSHVIIANNCLLAGYVEVADRVFIGGGSVFHQHVRIGELAMVQGISGIGKDIPPFAIAAEINGIAGLNAVGLRRAGLTPEQRLEIRDAFKLLYQSGLNVSQALERSTERKWDPRTDHFWRFVGAAKKRGLCDLLATRAAAH